MDKLQQGSSNSEHEQVKKLKLKLEGWREVLLPLYSVFVWRSAHHPGCIGGAVTLVFSLLWYFEPSLLTTLSIIGIVVCLLDYLVPVVSSHVFSQDKWTSQQERQYETVCLEMVRGQKAVLAMCHSVCAMKKDKPKLYVATVLTGLLLSAWIGNVFNNLFLTYLVVLFMTLLPGMVDHGIAQKVLSTAVFTIRDKIAKKTQ